MPGSGTMYSAIRTWHALSSQPCLLQVPSKVLCIAWTSDGTLLALGLYDGSVSLRDKGGNEQRRFSAAASPAWSIAWSPQVRVY
jgi:intraflagellar transport protein 122